MRRNALIAPALLGLLAATGADAQEADRYVLEKADDGFVRMDRQTGEMSRCSLDGASLVCKLAADERMAYQQEIEALQDAQGKLEERVAKLESSLAARLESALPSEEEFEKTMGYMERFLRGFMGIVKDMNEDERNDSATGPQKT